MPKDATLREGKREKGTTEQGITESVGEFMESGLGAISIALSQSLCALVAALVLVFPMRGGLDGDWSP